MRAERYGHIAPDRGPYGPWCGPGVARGRAAGNGGRSQSTTPVKGPTCIRPLHRGTARATLLAALVAVALAVLPIATATSQPAPEPAPPAEPAPGIVEVPVTFEVQNVNRSAVDCAADGATYQVRGHVVAPDGALGNPDYPAATLYLHGLAYGQFFYDFDEVAGYDYAAEQAAAGNVSVVIDRLGYDGSDKPTGTDICVGWRADIAHQIVTQLRSGDYSAEGAEAPTFEQVVLAGHSLGGQIAQVAAYSFGDIDGLIVISYSDTVQSQVLAAAAEDTAALCGRGGVPAEGESPPTGYAPFGDGTEMAFQAGNFTDAADPAVVAGATELRNLDPCGDPRRSPPRRRRASRTWRRSPCRPWS